ncbi:hypothetical protein AYR46_03930 [Sphingobium yanoikuyae]|uniref:hypothetical protein n=1 Tax=Sphingobium yanoikuyae TaxID=13690 RepID=UPI0007A75B87|nr:hypothetical protein [Sphingobium yanoikuyae]KZC82517.1 hypothetical protein AYR46_03930 [Sphingobium yanoikuyae]
MGFVKKLVALVAIAALTYYTFGAGGLVASGALGSGFLGVAIGSAIVAAGTYIIQTALMSSGRAPKMDAGKVNVRISDPPRWLHCGRARSGGGVVFGEFDAEGRFWYVVIHSDEILHAPYSYFLDDEPVTLGSDGYVQQAAFRLKTNKDRDPAEVDGEGRGYIRIWTTTYSATDPVPPRIAALDAALGTLWTPDHKLAGTTFSVVCMDAIKIEHRHKIYRWRGPFGMGEPAVSIVGDWSSAYDPRDPTQTLGNRTSYKPTRNAALAWAWFRTHPFGRGKPESSINWERIAQQADICDQTVTGIEGTQKRYEAALAIVDSKRRADAEREILLSCDGQLVFDEDGRSWVRVGHWEAPTLAFSRNRDIMAMSSVEPQDGESETQGVIVNYVEPDANYTTQPSAAWLNPLYYDPLSTPKFLTVDVLACTNHNQAMRLAKAIGMRSQPRHKITPVVNLRGLQARQQRIVTINYDNTFAGDYEIATNVELDGGGMWTSFGAVPVDPSRWTLLPGEEQPKPVVDGTSGTVTYPPIAGENVYYADSTLRIDFPVLARDDAAYVAEYIPTSAITGAETDPWTPMAINEVTAVSATVPAGVSYTVRYRYVVGSGAGSSWEYSVISPETPMPAPEGLTATGGVGQAVIGWQNPQDLRFKSSDTWRGSTTDFGSATKIVANYPGGVGQVQSITDTVAPGVWHYWNVATDGATVESDPAGPVSATVT